MFGVSIYLYCMCEVKNLERERGEREWLGGVDKRFLRGRGGGGGEKGR